MLEFVLGLLEFALELGALTWQQFQFVAAATVILIISALISPNDVLMGCLALAATALGIVGLVKLFYRCIN